MSKSPSKSTRRGQLKSGILLKQGKYVIDETISSGGFGVVYKASLAGPGIRLKGTNTFAIKELFPSGTVRKRGWIPWAARKEVKTPSDWEDYVERFLTECAVLQSMDHSGVVKIHEAFEENGTIYLVMDYIRGETLERFSESNRNSETREIVKQIYKVGKTLEYVHSKGIVHRDVSPWNILVCKNSPHLIDFGICKDFLSEEARTQLGTPCFMPPEPFLGRSQDPRSDQYGLAATAYYCISGELPQRAIERIHHDTMNTQTLIKAGLESHRAEAILRAMNIDPARRFHSLNDFLVALRQTETQYQESRKRQESTQFGVVAAIIIIAILAMAISSCG